MDEDSTAAGSQSLSDPRPASQQNATHAAPPLQPPAGMQVSVQQPVGQYSNVGQMAPVVNTQSAGTTAMNPSLPPPTLTSQQNAMQAAPPQQHPAGMQVSVQQPVGQYANFGQMAPIQQPGRYSMQPSWGSAGQQPVGYPQSQQHPHQGALPVPHPYGGQQPGSHQQYPLQHPPVLQHSQQQAFMQQQVLMQQQAYAQQQYGQPWLLTQPQVQMQQPHGLPGQYLHTGYPAQSEQMGSTSTPQGSSYSYQYQGPPYS